MCKQEALDYILKNSKISAHEVARCLDLRTSELNKALCDNDLPDEAVFQLEGLRTAVDALQVSGFTLDRTLLRRKIGCVSVFDVITSNGDVEKAADRLAKSLLREQVEREASMERAARLREEGRSPSSDRLSDALGRPTFVGH